MSCFHKVHLFSSDSDISLIQTEFCLAFACFTISFKFEFVFYSLKTAKHIEAKAPGLKTWHTTVKLLKMALYVH